MWQHYSGGYLFFFLSNEKTVLDTDIAIGIQDMDLYIGLATIDIMLKGSEIPANLSATAFFLLLRISNSSSFLSCRSCIDSIVFFIFVVYFRYFVVDLLPYQTIETTHYISF